MIFVNARFLSQNITGVQRFAIEISRRLKQISSDFVFVAPKNILHNDIAEELAVTKIGNNAGHVWEQFDLLRYLRKNDSPMLVNFGGLGPVNYSNKILTIHDLSFLRHPEWFSKKYYYFYRFLISKTANNSRQIITVSEFSKEEISKLLNIAENKIDVVYNAVGWDIYNDNIEKENTILAVSSLDPRKNFVNLIKAFNKLNLLDFRLKIVGSYINVHKKTNYMNLLNDSIEFTGYLKENELMEEYKKASLFAYPSLYEGFGIPPIEAMAMGCPVLTSNLSSMPEVCNDAAYFVNPNDVGSIADGIKKVLSDVELQNKLIENGYKNIKRFDWQKSAEKLYKITNSVE